MSAEPRPPLLRRVGPRQWDGLALVCALAYLVIAWGELAHQLRNFALVPLEALLVSAPIVIARRHPVMAFVLLLAVIAAPVRSAALAGLAAAPAAYVLYLGAARCRLRTSVLMLGCGIVLPFLAPAAGAHHHGAAPPAALLLITAWAVGYAVGQHRRYTTEVVRYHASRAEASAEKARREVGEERMRIARELHDVVAHSMSLITVQAAYGRLIVATKPTEAGTALAAIEEAGRGALAEMRRLLGVLREQDPDAASLAPVPGLAALAALAEETSRAGVQVSLSIRGDARELTPGIDLAAYRIVQESLTNIVKHSGADSAVVTVAYNPAAVVLEITDSGIGGDVSASPVGHGIAGMRERVAMYEGWFRAGPRPGGGFQVMARLPLEPQREAA